MPIKQNALNHPKAKESAADKTHFASTAPYVNLLALACTAGVSYGKISTKAKAPACEDAFGKAVAAPTDKRGFVMPEFLGRGASHAHMVYGHGGGYPQGRPHGFTRVFNHHAHPLCVKTQRVVLKSRKGALTMQVNPLGHHAPTLKAARAIPTTTEAQAHALLEATTSASLAAFYLRKGNVAAARRKAVQLLKILQVLEVPGHA